MDAPTSLPSKSPSRGRAVRTCASRPVYVRRLTVASAVFALGVGAIVWMVSMFILRDLSESYVSGIIRQAKDEAEAFARVMSDHGSFGDGETSPGMRGAAGEAIDPDAVLPPSLPEMEDESGHPIDPMPRAPLAEGGGGTDVPLRGVLRIGPSAGRMPGVLSTNGQELDYFVNGELIGRDVVQYIDIRYPGGRKRHLIRTIDEKSFDPSILNDPQVTVERVPIQFRPSSRRVTISWNAELDGQQVQFVEALDADVIDEGVAALRRRIIPKVLLGGGLFVALLVAAYAFVFRLVGEARRLEADANQQALLAEVGVLAAGLAHEIRNPLSAVHMNLQLLEEDLAQKPGEPVSSDADRDQVPPSAAEHLSLLRSAQKEIRRLGVLVADFLAYARPSAPRPAPHSFDAVVRDCVELFRPMALGAGVQLEMEMGAGDEPILLDEAMVKQALTNVIVNAIQAVPKPGGRVRVATVAAAGACEVSVMDNGPGLPEDTESLFRVFHSTKKGGSGLGLAISRAVVDRHGGSLRATNDEAGGAIFTITLPAERAA